MSLGAVHLTMKNSKSIMLQQITIIKLSSLFQILNPVEHQDTKFLILTTKERKAKHQRSFKDRITGKLRTFFSNKNPINEKVKEVKGGTFTPSNLTGVICPGTIQSGPADSTTASKADPLPMGFGCCKTFPLLGEKPT